MISATLAPEWLESVENRNAAIARSIVAPRKGIIRLPCDRLNILHAPRQKSERENSRVVGQLNCSEDATDERTKPRPRDRLAQSDAQRVVQLLQARDLGSQGRRRVHATAASGDAAQARETTGLRQLQGRPDTLAKQILRDRLAVHPGHGLAASETAPVIRKPSTGEPYAGKPPCTVRREGRPKAFPTPIRPSRSWRPPGLLRCARNDG